MHRFDAFLHRKYLFTLLTLRDIEELNMAVDDFSLEQCIVSESSIIQRKRNWNIERLFHQLFDHVYLPSMLATINLITLEIMLRDGRGVPSEPRSSWERCSQNLSKDENSKKYAQCSGTRVPNCIAYTTWLGYNDEVWKSEIINVWLQNTLKFNHCNRCYFVSEQYQNLTSKNLVERCLYTDSKNCIPCVI
jgi:hypothetical protein